MKPETNPNEQDSRSLHAVLGDAAELRAARREGRELRGYLKNLTATVKACVAALDEEMRRPSDEARGRRVAKITNALELQNDIAIRFGLKKVTRRASPNDQALPQGGAKETHE